MNRTTDMTDMANVSGTGDLTVLCVEDNAQVQLFNRPLLEANGFIVRQAMTLAEARRVVRQEMPGLIILDIHLPDGNGLDFLRELRKTSSTPVIALTNNSEERDLIDGLAGGCDDYITKPYTFPVLYARIEAVLRRAVRVPEIVTKGSLTLDITKMVARIRGDNMFLPQKEFALLLFFVQHEGKVVEGEDLYEKVWGQPMAGNSSAIKNMVYKLRKKLDGSGYTIRSERGEGYCFEME